MATIVKYTRKDGGTYAYSSIAQWDPEKKQSRPIRKYLGKVDPVTGEIIASSGKRGRPVGSKNKPRADAEDGTQREASGEDGSRIAALEEAVNTLAKQNAALQKEVIELRSKNAYYEAILRNVKNEVSKAVD